MILGTILWGIFYLIVAFILYAMYRKRQNRKYFEKHGMPMITGGSFKFLGMMLFNTCSFQDIEKDVYATAKKTGKGLVGITELDLSPYIYVIDLDIARNIYVKDFDHFEDRRPVQTEESNIYLKRMLFNMEGEQWRQIRMKLSPAFTTAKIRRMFALFKASSERLTKFIMDQTKDNVQLDLNFMDIFPKYTMDVIATCAFGIDSKCFEVSLGKFSEFEEMGKRFQFDFKPSVILKFMLVTVAPKIADYFKVEAFDTAPQIFFAGIIKNVMKQRRQTGQRYDDFLQLMMDAQQGLLKNDDDSLEVMLGTSTETGDDVNEMEEQGSNVKFDDDDIVANCMLFMLGGFDTTQTLLLMSLYQMALEQDMQERLYQEVKAKIDEHGGTLSYDAVNELQYLDRFLNEILRMYPTVRTERICTRDYAVPGTNFRIEKGVMVGMSVYAIHHDPDIFENPEKFDPDRFLPDKKAARHPYAFQPFGHGRRSCIGMRFALVKVKTAIAQLVHRFKFGQCQKTKIPIRFGTNVNIRPRDEDGMWLRVQHRL